MDSKKEVTHLSSEERRIIETGIRHGSAKTAIAKTIGKDNSTVGKEIAGLRILFCKKRFPAAGNGTGVCLSVFSVISAPYRRKGLSICSLRQAFRP